MVPIYLWNLKSELVTSKIRLFVNLNYAKGTSTDYNNLCWEKPPPICWVSSLVPLLRLKCIYVNNVNPVMD